MKYFRDNETDCNCGCGLNISLEMAEKLDLIRDCWGAPLLVTSGARCRKYNASINGAPGSAHITGQAVDIVPIKPKKVSDLHKFLVENADTLDIWIEDPAYTATWAHVSIRPTATRVFKP